MKHAATIVLLLICAGFSQIMPPTILDTLNIKGTVTENSGMLPVWLPLEGAMIVAYENNLIYYEPGAPIDRQMPLDTAYADKDGNFEFKQLVITTQMLYLTASHPGYYDSTAFITGLARTDSVRVSFTLNKIPEDKITLVMGKVMEGGNTGGVVNKPVEGATVTLTQKGRPGGVLGPISNQYSDVTDRNGDYEIELGLDSATTFLIWVTKAGYIAYTDSIKVTPGESLEVADIFLKPDGMPVVEYNPTFSGHKITAHPNPFQGAVALTVAGAQKSDLSMTIFDISGRRIVQQSAPFTWSGRDRSGRRAARGTYLAVIRDQSRVIGFKKLFAE